MHWALKRFSNKYRAAQFARDIKRRLKKEAFIMDFVNDRLFGFLYYALD